MRVDVFDGVEPNPTDKNVEAGAAMLVELGDACVIPIGGGSSMDCGKSVALLNANPGTVEEMQASVPAPATAPVIAVPTTAGTGSETNNACVITNTRLGRKGYVLHPSITPAFAVLDPNLTDRPADLPDGDLRLRRAHARDRGARLRTLQRLLRRHRPRSNPQGRRQSAPRGRGWHGHRSTFGNAACVGNGRAGFNISGLGSAHGTGHAISARLNAAHGQTLATMLPHVMAHNMPAREEKYIEVAKILEPSGAATGTGAIDAVVKIRSDIGIDKSISDLGGTDDLLATLVEDATADPVNFTNPVPADAEAFEKMYRAAW